MRLAALKVEQLSGVAAEDERFVLGGSFRLRMLLTMIWGIHPRVIARIKHPFGAHHFDAETNDRRQRVHGVEMDRAKIGARSLLEFHLYVL